MKKFFYKVWVQKRLMLLAAVILFAGCWSILSLGEMKAEEIEEPSDGVFQESLLGMPDFPPIDLPEAVAENIPSDTVVSEEEAISLPDSVAAEEESPKSIMALNGIMPMANANWSTLFSAAGFTPTSNTTINLDAPGTGTGYSYSSSNYTLTFNSSANNRSYELSQTSTGTLTRRISIASGVKVQLILNGVRIQYTTTASGSSTNSSPFLIPSNSTAYVYTEAGTTNNFTSTLNNYSSSGANSAGISVPSGATLVLGGQGTLNATAGPSSASAGIGGANATAAGTVTIYGGIVNATGGCYGYNNVVETKNTAGTVTRRRTTQYAAGGAGIGGGGGYTTETTSVNGGNGGAVNIYGGTVTAKVNKPTNNYAGGAGIGGGGGGYYYYYDHNPNTNTYTSLINRRGYGGTGGTVRITGGTVIATAAPYSAGIGSSYNRSTGGATTISGATVTATAGSNSAGIGAGYSGALSHAVSINNSVVRAYGSGYGAGIGGSYGAQTASISIANSTVTASSSSGAGIGSGYRGAVNGAINITGTSTVTASSSSGAGIGSGGGGAMNVALNFTGSGSITASSSSGAGIGGGSVYSTGSMPYNQPITIGGSLTVKASSSTGAGIGSGYGYASTTSNSVTTRYPNLTPLQSTITITGTAKVTASSNSGAGIGSGYTSAVNGGLVINSTATVNASSTSGAGIGSGCGGIMNVNLSFTTGVNITASSNTGAGIGSGAAFAYTGTRTYTRSITIGGTATVKATSVNGAAIGTGYGYYTLTSNGTTTAYTNTTQLQGAITISGSANVTATTTGSGAGIGSGYYSNVTSTLTINTTGKVKLGSGSGAGIGTGQNGTLSGNITVRGTNNFDPISVTTGTGIGSGNGGAVSGTISVTLDELTVNGTAGMGIGSGGNLSSVLGINIPKINVTHTGAGWGIGAKGQLSAYVNLTAGQVVNIKAVGGYGVAAGSTTTAGRINITGTTKLTLDGTYLVGIGTNGANAGQINMQNDAPLVKIATVSSGVGIGSRNASTGAIQIRVAELDITGETGIGVGALGNMSGTFNLIVPKISVYHTGAGWGIGAKGQLATTVNINDNKILDVHAVGGGGVAAGSTTTAGRIIITDNAKITLDGSYVIGIGTTGANAGTIQINNKDQIVKMNTVNGGTGIGSGAASTGTFLVNVDKVDITGTNGMGIGAGGNLSGNINLKIPEIHIKHTGAGWGIGAKGTLTGRLDFNEATNRVLHIESQGGHGIAVGAVANTASGIFITDYIDLALTGSYKVGIGSEGNNAGSIIIANIQDSIDITTVNGGVGIGTVTGNSTGTISVDAKKLNIKGTNGMGVGAGGAMSGTFKLKVPEINIKHSGAGWGIGAKGALSTKIQLDDASVKTVDIESHGGHGVAAGSISGVANGIIITDNVRFTLDGEYLVGIGTTGANAGQITIDNKQSLIDITTVDAGIGIGAQTGASTGAILVDVGEIKITGTNGMGVGAGGAMSGSFKLLVPKINIKHTGTGWGIGAKGALSCAIEFNNANTTETLEISAVGGYGIAAGSMNANGKIVITDQVKMTLDGSYLHGIGTTGNNSGGLIQIDNENQTVAITTVDNGYGIGSGGLSSGTILVDVDAVHINGTNGMGIGTGGNLSGAMNLIVPDISIKHTGAGWGIGAKGQLTSTISLDTDNEKVYISSQGGHGIAANTIGNANGKILITDDVKLTLDGSYKIGIGTVGANTLGEIRMDNHEKLVKIQTIAGGVGIGAGGLSSGIIKVDVDEVHVTGIDGIGIGAGGNMSGTFELTVPKITINHSGAGWGIGAKGQLQCPIKLGSNTKSVQISAEGGYGVAAGSTNANGKIIITEEIDLGLSGTYLVGIGTTGANAGEIRMDNKASLLAVDTITNGVAFGTQTGDSTGTIHLDVKKVVTNGDYGIGVGSGGSLNTLNYYVDEVQAKFTGAGLGIGARGVLSGQVLLDQNKKITVQTTGGYGVSAGSTAAAGKILITGNSQLALNGTYAVGIGTNGANAGTICMDNKAPEVKIETIANGIGIGANGVNSGTIALDVKKVNITGISGTGVGIGSNGNSTGTIGLAVDTINISGENGIGVGARGSMANLSYEVGQTDIAFTGNGYGIGCTGALSGKIQLDGEKIVNITTANGYGIIAGSTTAAGEIIITDNSKITLAGTYYLGIGTNGANAGNIRMDNNADQVKIETVSNGIGIGAAGNSTGNIDIKVKEVDITGVNGIAVGARGTMQHMELAVNKISAVFSGAGTGIGSNNTLLANGDLTIKDNERIYIETLAGYGIVTGATGANAVIDIDNKKEITLDGTYTVGIGTMLTTTAGVNAGTIRLNSDADVLFIETAGESNGTGVGIGSAYTHTGKMDLNIKEIYIKGKHGVGIGSLNTFSGEVAMDTELLTVIQEGIGTGVGSYGTLTGQIELDDMQLNIESNTGVAIGGRGNMTGGRVTIGENAYGDLRTTTGTVVGTHGQLNGSIELLSNTGLTIKRHGQSANAGIGGNTMAASGSIELLGRIRTELLNTTGVGIGSATVTSAGKITIGGESQVMIEGLSNGTGIGSGGTPANSGTANAMTIRIQDNAKVDITTVNGTAIGSNHLMSGNIILESDYSEDSSDPNSTSKITVKAAGARPIGSMGNYTGTIQLLGDYTDLDITAANGPAIGSANILSGKITIDGAISLETQGTANYPAIGGFSMNNINSSITICGGADVTAEGTLRGAGIGSGTSGVMSGTITIADEGTRVYAKGGTQTNYGGAGIGSGSNIGFTGKINIVEGAVVESYGGGEGNGGAAGIGSGRSGASSGTVTIESDTEVIAVSSKAGGAGIGSGEGGSRETKTYIYDGADVTAYSASAVQPAIDNTDTATVIEEPAQLFDGYFTDGTRGALTIEVYDNETLEWMYDIELDDNYCGFAYTTDDTRTRNYEVYDQEGDLLGYGVRANTKEERRKIDATSSPIVPTPLEIDACVISGTLWLDDNKNGIMDTSEKKLGAGVEVHLLEPVEDEETNEIEYLYLGRHTTTDASGNYKMIVVDGDYKLQFTRTDVYGFTDYIEPEEREENTSYSDVDLQGVTGVYTMTEEEWEQNTLETVNAGYAMPNTEGMYLNKKIQDPFAEGDEPVYTDRIDLVDTTQIITYKFESRLPDYPEFTEGEDESDYPHPLTGFYQIEIRETLPQILKPAYEDITESVKIYIDGVPSRMPEAYLTYDAETNRIFCRLDLDRNLMGANGKFIELYVDTKFVSALPDEYLNPIVNTGRLHVNEMILENGDISSVVIDTNQEGGSTQAFINIQGEISGYVFDDKDSDGVYDMVGDAPLEDVTVHLYEVDEEGEIIDPQDGPVETEITDENGYYSFHVDTLKDYILLFPKTAYNGKITQRIADDPMGSNINRTTGYADVIEIRKDDAHRFATVNAGYLVPQTIDHSFKKKVKLKDSNDGFQDKYILLDEADVDKTFHYQMGFTFPEDMKNYDSVVLVDRLPEQLELVSNTDDPLDAVIMYVKNSVESGPPAVNVENYGILEYNPDTREIIFIVDEEKLADNSLANLSFTMEVMAKLLDNYLNLDNQPMKIINEGLLYINGENDPLRTSPGGSINISGTLSGIVFRDQNGNNYYDQGDILMKDIDVELHQLVKGEYKKVDEKRTNANGKYEFIVDLDEDYKVVVSTTQAVENDYLGLVKPGYGNNPETQSHFIRTTGETEIYQMRNKDGERHQIANAGYRAPSSGGSGEFTKQLVDESGNPVNTLDIDDTEQTIRYRIRVGLPDDLSGYSTLEIRDILPGGLIPTEENIEDCVTVKVGENNITSEGTLSYTEETYYPAAKPGQISFYAVLQDSWESETIVMDIALKLDPTLTTYPSSLKNSASLFLNGEETGKNIPDTGEPTLNVKAVIRGTVFNDRDRSQNLTTADSRYRDVEVKLYTENGTPVASTTTSDSGTYSFKVDLGSGPYVVEFPIYKSGAALVSKGDDSESSDSHVNTKTGRTDAFSVGSTPTDRIQIRNAGYITPLTDDLEFEKELIVDDIDKLETDDPDMIFTYEMRFFFPEDMEGYDTLSVVDLLPVDENGNPVLEPATGDEADVDADVSVFVDGDSYDDKGHKKYTAADNSISFTFHKPIDFDAVAGKEFILQVQTKMNVELEEYPTEFVNDGKLVINGGGDDDESTSVGLPGDKEKPVVSVKGRISGYAFYDSDNNGLHQNDEYGHEGVEVKLYRDNAHVATTRTSSSGYYYFSVAMDNADYYVSFPTTIGSYGLVQRINGCEMNSNASHADPANGNTHIVQVGAGREARYQQLNAGYRRPLTADLNFDKRVSLTEDNYDKEVLAVDVSEPIYFELRAWFPEDMNAYHSVKIVDNLPDWLEVDKSDVKLKIDKTPLNNSYGELLYDGTENTLTFTFENDYENLKSLAGREVSMEIPVVVESSYQGDPNVIPASEDNTAKLIVNYDTSANPEDTPEELSSSATIHWGGIIEGYLWHDTETINGIMEEEEIPLVGYPVILQEYVSDDSWRDVREIETNENGYYQFTVPRGTYRIEAPKLTSKSVTEKHNNVSPSDILNNMNKNRLSDEMTITGAENIYEVNTGYVDIWVPGEDDVNKYLVDENGDPLEELTINDAQTDRINYLIVVRLEDIDSYDSLEIVDKLDPRFRYVDSRVMLYDGSSASDITDMGTIVVDEQNKYVFEFHQPIDIEELSNKEVRLYLTLGIADNVTDFSGLSNSAKVIINGGSGDDEKEIGSGGGSDEDPPVVKLGFGYIEGDIFKDMNRNSYQDENDLPIEGMTVILKQKKGDKWKPIATTQSKEDGSYAFTTTDLDGEETLQSFPFGSYQIKIQHEYSRLRYVTRWVDGTRFNRRVSDVSTATGEVEFSLSQSQPRPKPTAGLRDLGSNISKEQSAPPVIAPIYEGDRIVGGTGVPGAEIIVTFPDESTGDAVVDEDGIWTVLVPDGTDLAEGDVTKAIQTEEGKAPADAKEIVQGFPNGEASRRPGVSGVQQGDTIVSGTGIPGSDISVIFPGGGISWGTVGDTGKWSVVIPDGMDLAPGDALDVTQTEQNKSESDPSYREVTGLPGKSEPPIVNEFNQAEREITGTGDPDATITITFPDIEGQPSYEVTVDGEGNWTLELPDNIWPKEEDEIYFVQEELEKTPSDPKTATVGEPAQSEQPDVDPVTPDDDRIKGTGVPGSEITVTFPDDTWRETVVDPDGNWEVMIPDETRDFDEEEEISVIQTEKDKKPSDDRTQKIDYPETSAQPDINDVELDDREITGTGIPDSKITVIFPNGDKVETTVDKDGNWTVEVPDGIELEEDQKINARQREKGKKESKDIETDVKAPTPRPKSEEPIVDEIKQAERQITGTGEPDSKITIIFPNIEGEPSQEVFVDENGSWTLTLPDEIWLQEDDEIIFIQEEPEKDPSDPVTQKVGEPEKSQQPDVDPITTDDGQITGTGEPGSVITVTFPDGTEVSTTVDENRNWEVTIPDETQDLREGDKVIVTQIERDKRPSDEESRVVEDINIIEPPEPEEEESAPPVIAPVYDEDRIIGGAGVPGAEIEVIFPDGSTATTTVDENGDWTVRVPDSTELEEGNIITARQTEEGKTPADADEVVQGTPEGDRSRRPGVSDTQDKDHIVTGTGVPGSEIIVTFPGGKTATGSVGDDGKWSVNVPDDVKLEPGDQLIVTQIEKDKEESGESEGDVISSPEKSKPPVIDPVTPDDEYITGTGEPGAEITVTFPDGSEKKTIVEDDGTWKVKIPDDTREFEEGEEITAIQKEKDKEPSDEEKREIIYPETSEPPEIDDIEPGDRKITGEGEPDSEITVTFPDGSEEKTTVDKDGKWTVDVPDEVELKEDDKVRARQRKRGKKESEESEKIVKPPEEEGGGGKEPPEEGGGGKEPPEEGGGGKEPPEEGGGGKEPSEEGGGGKEPPEEGGGGKEPPEEGGGGKEPPEEGGGGKEPPEEGGGGKEPPEEGGGGKEPPEEGGGGKEPPEEGGGGKEPPGEGGGGKEPPGEGGGGKEPPGEGGGSGEPPGEGGGSGEPPGGDDGSGKPPGPGDESEESPGDGKDPGDTPDDGSGKNNDGNTDDSSGANETDSDGKEGMDSTPTTSDNLAPEFLYTLFMLLISGAMMMVVFMKHNKNNR